MAKILTVYYSRTGENYGKGGIQNLTVGNTARAAAYVQKAVGGDLFEVQPVREYDKDYYKCTEEAKAELREQARPALRAYPENFESYDVIFVGYPNWWGTMPMCMFTLLEHFDLSGKTVVPFCTNEGSGMGVSERDLAVLCKNATLKAGLAIRGSEVEKAEAAVSKWAKAAIL